MSEMTLQKKHPNESGGEWGLTAEHMTSYEKGSLKGD